MVRTKAQLSGKPVVADGKRRLIDAALRLGARGIGLSSLGLRELAREASLNHNTFYRHFRDIEELAELAGTEIAEQIMAGMRQIRAQSEKHADATAAAVAYYLDFVEDHPDAFIVGLRELHGGTPRMREIFRKVIDYIAQESVDQISSMNLVPGLAPEALRETTTPMAYYMFYRALDLIDHPERKAEIAAQMTQVIRGMFLGALALLASGPEQARPSR